jgi:hypothetical protein
MMMSMKHFAKSTMPRKRHSNSYSSYSTLFAEVTQFHNTTNKQNPLTQEFVASQNYADPKSYTTQPSKRQAPLSKGKSPAAKHTLYSPAGWDGGQGGRGPSPHRSVSKLLTNKFEQLAMSNAPLSSKLN